MKKNTNNQHPDGDYFCHIVIPAKDYQASKVFFETVFGWKVQEAPGANFLDVLPPSGQGPSAELNSEEETVVPVISTSDIEGKLRLIEAYGGKRLQGKTAIGNDAEYGYYALFEDPQGNKMSLYSES